MALKNEAALSWLVLQCSGRRHSDKCRHLDRRIRLEIPCRLAEADTSGSDYSAVCLVSIRNTGGDRAIEAAFTPT